MVINHVVHGAHGCNCLVSCTEMCLPTTKTAHVATPIVDMNNMELKYPVHESDLLHMHMLIALCNLNTVYQRVRMLTFNECASLWE